MKNLICFLFMVISFAIFSQEKRSFYMETTPKLGFLLAHRGVMGHVPESHAFGNELSLGITANGSKRWHEVFNFPRMGLTLYNSTVGNNEILGTCHGLFSFIEFPFEKSKRFEFSGKIGCGLSYNTNVYDVDLNPKNVALSTHINTLVSFGLQSRFFFGKNHLVAGIDMTHASNGATRVPNLGINLPYIKLGFGRKFGNEVKAEQVPDFLAKKWQIGLMGIFSVKQVFPTGGRTYPIYAMSALAYKKTGLKSGIEFAVDFIYKTSIRDYKRDLYPVKSDASIAQAGVYVGYVLPLDRMRFVTGMGFYVVDKYNPEDAFYHRVGMRYQASRNLLINLTLKSHWAKADYVEYGIAYVF
jgi:hypothetical protein